MFKLLSKIRWLQFKRYFHTRGSGKIITSLLFLVVFLTVAIGIFEFFFKGFNYLNYFSFFRSVITLYAFEMFFLIFAFLVFLGSGISLLFSLFKSKNSQLLITSPKFYLIPRYAIGYTFISSLWMFLFVLLPALWAASLSFKISFNLILLELIASILTMAAVVLFAYCLIMLTALAIYEIKLIRLSFKNVTLGFFILTIALLVLSTFKLAHHDIVEILSAENLKILQAPIEPVLQRFDWLPSSPAAHIMVSAQAGDSHAIFLSLIKILGLLALTIIPTWWLSNSFLSFWQQMAENSGNLAQTKINRKTSQAKNFSLFKTGFGAIFYKETILLFRNAKNGLWLFFLSILWLSYIGFNLNLNKALTRHNDTLGTLPNILISIQLLILVYFISSMVLRFAFPSFSAERSTAWILASSPVSWGKILWAKFSFFALIFCVFALVAEAINIFLLHLSAPHAGLFLLLCITSTIFVTALGLFLGARFPNFETDDPQSLSTSMPGLAFVFSAIIYGALAVLFYYLYLVFNSHILPVLFALGSLIISWALMESAAKSINNLDFIVEQHD